MRFLLLFIFTILTLQATAQDYKAASNDLYGYTADMPIPMKMKGRLKSLHRAENFVKHLQRDNGGRLIMISRSSIKDPNYKKQDAVLQPVGNSKLSMVRVHDFSGWLDVFTLQDEQSKEQLQVYIDIYHEGEAQVPKGLKYVP